MNIRKTIKLEPDEERLLRTMYYGALVPTDQYSRRPAFWRGFTAIWNNATERDDSREEVLHWLVTRRKRPHGRSGRLEAIGESHKRLCSLDPDVLTKEQWETLAKIYREINVGSDNFVFDVKLSKRLVELFLESTGEHVPATTLVAALIARRKDGFLGHIDHSGLSSKDGDIGFGDIDQVAG